MSNENKALVRSTMEAMWNEGTLLLPTSVLLAITWATRLAGSKGRRA